jgi:hypothetical protein
MEARLKLKPGQNGTKKLLARFGERLVCVRYRYDEARSLRFTTVELIVSQSAWQPRKRSRASPRSSHDMVYVRIAYDDIALRAKMKTLGALWRPRQKLWELPWGAVQALGIEHRVISNTTDKPDKPIPPTPDM